MQHTKCIGDSLQERLVKSSELVSDYRRKEPWDLVSGVEYFLTCILDEVVAQEQEGVARYPHPNKHDDRQESYVAQNIDLVFPESDLAIKTTPGLGHTPAVKEGNTQDMGQIPENRLSCVVPDGVTYYKFPEVDEGIPGAENTGSTNQYGAIFKDTGSSTQCGTIVKNICSDSQYGTSVTYTSSDIQYGVIVKYAGSDNQYSTIVEEKIKQWEPAGLRKSLSADTTDLLSSEYKNLADNIFQPKLTGLPWHTDEANRYLIGKMKPEITMPNFIEGTV